MFRSPHVPNVIVLPCLVFSEGMKFRVPQCVVFSTLLLSCLLESNHIILSTLSSFNVRSQVSHPFKIVGKHEGSFFLLLSVGLPVANAPDVLQPCGLLYHP